MKTEYDFFIDKLGQRIDNLIKLYIDLQKKCEGLEKENMELRHRNEHLQSRSQQLEKDINNLKMADALQAGEGNEEAKMKISRLVREIDKCIALLNY